MVVDRYEHPDGFSCMDVDDMYADLELKLGAAYRSLARIETWVGRALERLDREELTTEEAETIWRSAMEDAQAEAAEKTRIR